MSKKTAWKFLNRDVNRKITSNYDGSEWVVGEWRVGEPPTKECVGLNASRYIQHALKYVKGNCLARVEYDGKIVESNDKLTCEKMRLVEIYEWTPRHSVKLAIFAARSVLKNWSVKYPHDRRPLDAIEAAEKWLTDTADSTICAASAAANAAYSASDNAEYSAARAAYSAADSVYNAAYSAASAAASAAESAEACMDRKIHNYCVRMVKP